jgi:predicted HD phosphohydrolase
MPASKLRRQLAWEAARLMFEFPALSYADARQEAARRISPAGLRQVDMPTDEELGRQLRSMTAPSGDAAAGEHEDRFAFFRALLAPLENVRQNPKTHLEGDALYHSLQTFDHARDVLPYDEEFLTVALLHDVGKAIEPLEHGRAAVAALAGHLDERMEWLIENHEAANALAEGRLGSRAKKQLQQSPWYDDLVLLGQCDRAARQPGVVAPTLDEALDYLRELATMYGG